MKIFIVIGVANEGEHEDETDWIVCASFLATTAEGIARAAQDEHDRIRAEGLGDAQYTVDLTRMPHGRGPLVYRVIETELR